MAARPGERAFPPPVRSPRWRRREMELARRVDEALLRARSVLGIDVSLTPVENLPLDQAIELVMTITWAAVERVRDARASSRRAAELCALVVELQELSDELYEHDLGYHARRLAECEAGLGRLRAIDNTADLIDRVCLEGARSCGFERFLLSRVEDGTWRPWMAEFSSAQEFQQWFDHWLGREIPLDQMAVETGLLEQRRASLIHDTATTPVHPIVTEGRSISYVVAPIMPAGTVVGFLHADYYPHPRRCDELDRDVLWAFAEGFGHLYERTVLIERLRVQRDQIREAMGDADTLMEDLCTAEVELARKGDSGSVVARTISHAMLPESLDLDELTAREREVLSLMVAGANNSAIAERLVISEGTVKSHVKHILRKLGVVNRSQAIALYLGASEGG